MVVPNTSDLINYLNQLKIRLNECINKKVKYNELYLDSIKNSFVIKNPLIMYENRKQKLDIMLDKINNIIAKKIDNFKVKMNYIKANYTLNNPTVLYKDDIHKLNLLVEKLELLNPLAILKRGYTVTYQNDKIIKSIKDIDTKNTLKIKFFDGFIDVKKVGD